MLSQEKNCYLGINGKKVGPVSEADIQKLYDHNKITGDTKFARAGDKEWITVSETGIFTPPLAHEDNDLPPLPTEDEPAKNAVGVRKKSKLGFVAASLGVVIVSIVIMIGIFSNPENETTGGSMAVGQSDNAPTVSAADTSDALQDERDVSDMFPISQWNGRFEESGNIQYPWRWRMDFLIRNNSGLNGAEVGIFWIYVDFFDAASVQITHNDSSGIQFSTGVETIRVTGAPSLHGADVMNSITWGRLITSANPSGGFDGLTSESWIFDIIDGVAVFREDSVTNEITLDSGNDAESQEEHVVLDTDNDSASAEFTQLVFSEYANFTLNIPAEWEFFYNLHDDEFVITDPQRGESMWAYEVHIGDFGWFSSVDAYLDFVREEVFPFYSFSYFDDGRRQMQAIGDIDGYNRWINFTDDRVIVLAVPFTWFEQVGNPILDIADSLSFN